MDLWCRRGGFPLCLEGAFSLFCVGVCVCRRGFVCNYNQPRERAFSLASLQRNPFLAWARIISDVQEESFVQIRFLLQNKIYGVCLQAGMFFLLRLRVERGNDGSKKSDCNIVNMENE